MSFVYILTDVSDKRIPFWAAASDCGELVCTMYHVLPTAGGELDPNSLLAKSAYTQTTKTNLT